MAKGKRIGTRRAAPQRTLPSRSSLLLCLGITLAVVAWGYLVKAAIDFGTSARDGESLAWVFLGLACVGAAACLFAGLLLGARLLRSIGVLTDHRTAPEGPPTPEATAAPTPQPHAPEADEPPTYTPPPGPYRGKRVAR